MDYTTPSRTFSVGFEQQFAEDIMSFTFTDPKIVIKSLFPNFMILNKPHIFTPPLPIGVLGTWKYVFLYSS